MVKAYRRIVNAYPVDPGCAVSLLVELDQPLISSLEGPRVTCLSPREACTLPLFESNGPPLVRPDEASCASARSLDASLLALDLLLYDVSSPAASDPPGSPRRLCAEGGRGFSVMGRMGDKGGVFHADLTSSGG